MISQLLAKIFPSKKATPAAPMLKRILLIDPRNQSISEVDDTDLASIIDTHLGDQGVDNLQLDHDNSLWFSNRTVSDRYAWYLEGMATGEYEERRYCKGILVGFKEDKAWDRLTLLSYLRWYDKRNIYSDV